MKKVTVFCGSSSGSNPVFKEQAFHIGACLATNGMDVVYGGAKIGLMGAVADGALSKGGKVIGILPEFLGDKEIRHDTLSELIFVSSMHERKMLMHTKCDAFIALPGGYGTLEELCEILTWAQLGLHHKPIGIVNINGYFDCFVQMLDVMLTNGFLSKTHRDLVILSDSIENLLPRMVDYVPQTETKWIDEDDV